MQLLTGTERMESRILSIKKLALKIRRYIEGSSYDFLEFIYRCLFDKGFKNPLKSELICYLKTEPLDLSLIYQYYNQPQLDVYRSQAAPKVVREDIPIKTFVATPVWIAEFLVENSLGRLWMRLHPDSRLAERMRYYIPDLFSLPWVQNSINSADSVNNSDNVDGLDDVYSLDGTQGRVFADNSLRIPSGISRAADISILDPAAGTFNLLIAAYRVLFMMYLEEIVNVGRPSWPDKPSSPSIGSIPQMIWENNLFGLEIDPFIKELGRIVVAIELARGYPICADGACFGVEDIDCVDGVCDDICWEDIRELVDSVDRKVITGDAIELYDNRLFCDKSFDIILLNPPYLDKRDYLPSLKEKLRELFPISMRNLYTVFLEWSIKRLKPGGLLSAITPQSFMFLPTYEKLRSFIRKEADVELLVQSGLDTFPDIVVDCAFYVLRRRASENRGFSYAKGMSGIDHYSANGSTCESGDLGIDNRRFCNSNAGLYIKLTDMAFSDKRLRLEELARKLRSVSIRGPGVKDDTAGRDKARVDATRQQAIGQEGGRTIKEKEYEAKSNVEISERLIKKGRYHLENVEGQTKGCTRKKDMLSEDCYIRSADYFNDLPHKSWVYWATDGVKKLFAKYPRLGEIATIKQGLATTDNARFVRFWWEVPYDHIGWSCSDREDARTSNYRWFPYIKGGAYKRWYGNREYVVDWKDDGLEIKKAIIEKYPYLNGRWEWVAKNSSFYFKEGITYSYLTSGKFSARLLPRGSIFDVAGSAVFAENYLTILGLLNSRVVQFLLGLINPTVNFQVGDLRLVPIPEEKDIPAIKELVLSAISLMKRIESFNETSPEFLLPPSWDSGISQISSIKMRLSSIQRALNEHTYRAYKLEKDDIRLIENKTTEDVDYCEDLDMDQLAYRWISFSVGVFFGRFNPKGGINTENSSLIKRPVKISILARYVKEILRELLGSSACELFSFVGNMEEYLKKRFFKLHFKEYRRSPLYIPLKPDGGSVVYYHHIFDSSFDICDIIGISDISNIDNIVNINIKRGLIDYSRGIRNNLPYFKKHLLYPSWARC